MSVKRLARQIYFTGKASRVPTEEEESTLQSKYKIAYKHQPTFNNTVADLVRGEVSPEKKDTGTSDRHKLADIVEAFEELFNVDLDNVSTGQYRALEKKLNMVKEYFTLKIEKSDMSRWYKASLKQEISNCETANSLLVLLYFRVGIAD